MTASFSRADFRQVRLSALAFIGAVAASLSFLLLSDQFLDGAQDRLSGARRQLNEARNRLATAREDQENMVAYAAGYGQLDERHIIGDDQRLDWVEGLESLRRRNLVMGLSYTISPQTSYAPPYPLTTGNFNLNYSEMKLKLELLHEDQLIGFFDALRSDSKGWFMLERCTVKRLPVDPFNQTVYVPHLQAECSGGWLTLKNRNEP